ncbi:MAG TPA: HDIG domain-containing metalloprotein [Coriobacteriia bacterium]
MGRYREITSRAVTKLPDRFKSPFAGRFIIYTLVASVAMFIVAAGSAAVFVVSLVQGTSLELAVRSALWGALGAATATIAALILMPFIRDGLGLAEDIRLLEAASPAHPLMKELITRAPGTYTHSVATANLAEAAAECIGADTLLTRVGAYYHDIGKIRRPVYFFENQQPGFNPHDEVVPQLSAVIITAHVNDGLELAKQYHLSPRIQAIIRQHHGTSLVRYFYNKAAAVDAGVFEADFRYQGEKPDTREAALVMLADSNEAAVRALRQPSEPRVRAVVRSIVEEKLADGQLDDSQLSVGDMERVVETYSSMLTSMYHARCEYPPAPEKTERPVNADQHREPSRA